MYKVFGFDTGDNKTVAYNLRPTIRHSQLQCKLSFIMKNEFERVPFVKISI